MFDTTSLWLFAGASLALAATPGPAVLYIIARSVDQGRTAGVASALGIATGGAVHVLAAAAGLSALLARSATAFAAVKYVGAAYLIFLGWSRLRAPVAPSDASPAPRRRSLGRLFRDGVVVNVLNPKTAVFFLAFLPQFVDPASGTVPSQIILLGSIFVGIAAASDITWAMVAGTLAGQLRVSRGYQRAQRYVTGGIFVALGIATAVSGRK